MLILYPSNFRNVFLANLLSILRLESRNTIFDCTIITIITSSLAFFQLNSVSRVAHTNYNFDIIFNIFMNQYIFSIQLNCFHPAISVYSRQEQKTDNFSNFQIPRYKNHNTFKQSNNNKYKIMMHSLNIQRYETSLHSYSNMEGYIIQQIDNMNNNRQAKQSQAMLDRLYDQDGQLFVNCLFDIANKSRTVVGVDPGLVANSTHFVLLYLRHFIQKQQQRTNNLCPAFTKTYYALFNTNFRPLIVKCFSVFLSKPCHLPYLRDFLQQSTHSILTDLQKQQLCQQMLLMIGEVLEAMMESVQYRPGVSMESTRIINSIVNQWGIKGTLGRINRIRSEVWVWSMVMLVQFSKGTLSTDIIISSLSIPTLPLKVKMELWGFIQRIWDNLYNIQTIYLLISTQIKQMQDVAFLQQMQQSLEIQPIQGLLKSLQYLIKSAILCITKLKSYQSPPVIDINQHMLIEYFYEYQFFYKFFSCSMELIIRFHHESRQLLYTMTYILQAYFDFIGEQATAQFAHRIKQQVKGDLVFVLLAAMPRNVMQNFQATQVLAIYLDTFVGAVDSGNLNKQLFVLYLQFVIHYISNYHYIEPEIFNKLSKLSSYLLQAQPNPSIQQQQQQQQLTMHTILQCYGVSIGCRLDKFNGKIDIPKLTNIFKLCWNVMKQCMVSMEGVGREEAVMVVVDGWNSYYWLGVKRLEIYDLILELFSNVIVNSFDEDQHYLYLQALKILSNYHEKSLTQSQLDRLTKIVTVLLKTANKSLQDQCCQLTLKILCNTNIEYYKKIINKQQFKHIYSKVYETSIYTYITKQLEKYDDDPIYCKVLMETLGNQEGQQFVASMLIAVQSRSYAYSKQLVFRNWDPVWEALVVLRNQSNQITEQKGINSRFSQINQGSIQALLMNLSLEQKKAYKRETEIKSAQVVKLNWSYLPSVRKVLEAGSIIGTLVQQKLNSR